MSRPVILSLSLSFFPLTRPPPRSTLFPYTTLFRSDRGDSGATIAERAEMSQHARRRSGAMCEQAVRQSAGAGRRSEEHTSELQSRFDLVCRLLLEKKKHTAKY